MKKVPLARDGGYETGFDENKRILGRQFLAVEFFCFSLIKASLAIELQRPALTSPQLPFRAFLLRYQYIASSINIAITHAIGLMRNITTPAPIHPLLCAKQ